MGKKFSTALIVVGVVLVALAVVWWLVIAPMLVKLPSDVNTRMDFQGNLTLYVDPSTGQPLAAGQELKVPITAVRTFVSLADLYTSKVAVFEDKTIMTAAGQESPAQIYHYAMDRKTRKCVESTENWAYDKSIVLNRVGYYGPLFPGGLKVGDTISVFSDDPAKVFDISVTDKTDNWNNLGITVLKIDAKRASAPYNQAVAQALLATGQGLPMQLTFAQLAAQLKAQTQGALDLEALLNELGTVASAEDMQSLQTVTQQPIKLVYNQESGDVVYIEQKTGAIVGATLDRTTTMNVDTTGLVGALAIIAKYATNPTIGPDVTKAVQAATQLAQAAPSKVFNQNMSITSTSEGSLAQDAKGKIPLLNLADLWIPLIIVVVGGLLLILGAIALGMKSRKTAA